MWALVVLPLDDPQKRRNLSNKHTKTMFQMLLADVRKPDPHAAVQKYKVLPYIETEPSVIPFRKKLFAYYGSPYLFIIDFIFCDVTDRGSCKLPSCSIEWPSQ
jgi:hypothetical protein